MWARAQPRPRSRRGRQGCWSACSVGERFSAGLDGGRVELWASWLAPRSEDRVVGERFSRPATTARVRGSRKRRSAARASLGPCGIDGTFEPRDEPSPRVSGPGDPDALLSLPAPSPIFCFWPDLCFFAPQAKNRNQALKRDDLHCRSQHCARTRRPWRVHGPRRDLGPVRDAERPRIVPPGRRSSDARQVRCGLRPGGRPGRARPLPAQGCRRRGRRRRVARAERSEDPRAFYFVSSPRPQATGTTTWSRCRAWSCRPRLSLPAARNASRCSSTTATGPTPSSTA